ncbi:MAG: DNA translocase FtsK 4TM domain-containing protein [Sandaracinaceae bacterium]|nr:DNA translocase FtsK 4TM domain-containing protein [Sandaracinaceae bacterium]
MLGIFAATWALLMGLSLWSYDAAGGDNLVGPVGTGLASALATAFGVAAWLLPIELGLAARRLFSGRRGLLGAATIASTLVIVFIGCALLHLAMPSEQVFGGHLPGGRIGEVLGEVLRSLFGFAGAVVLGVAILLVTLVLRTPVSVVDAARMLTSALREGYGRVSDAIRAVAEAWREAKALEAEEHAAQRALLEPKVITAGAPATAEPAAGPDTRDEGLSSVWDDEDLEEARVSGAALGARPSGAAHVVYDDEEEHDEVFDEDEDEDADSLELAADADVEDDDSAVEDDDEAGMTVVSPLIPAAVTPKRSLAQVASVPKIVVPEHMRREVIERERVPTVRAARGEFELPGTDLLDEPSTEEVQQDPADLKRLAELLVRTLDAYKIKGRVDEIHPGPVVTMYEFEPESGTKVSKIRGLADDLAMALAVEKVRIVAPIPGKARVGFELPNTIRQTVSLREILELREWQDHKGHLPVAFGKDIAGKPVYGDLSKMPHLLVAGATGAGKSVGLNVMLVSLLAKKTPEEVRMLMIDPKVVELAVFDGIPHMLLPVVTDMSKAALALKWAVDEMERRYQLFADVGSKNIITFNRKVERVIAGELPPDKFQPRRVGKVTAQGINGEEVLMDPDDDEVPDALDAMPEKLPYIVVVVDEFADLMMVAAKDVETCIARLAQKARAAGIHVILATQRPSVDVITGMIKANFPCRIAFKVSSQPDSKTILNRQGAEHLLGRGDMLMIPPGSSDLKRVHSAYISEDEVQALCDHLREQGKPTYDENILKPRDDEEGMPASESDDPLYDKAVAVVAEEGTCSISRLQRKLKVGYNKAASLVEMMEQHGIVGPPNGKAGGRREVLIQAH